MTKMIFTKHLTAIWILGMAMTIPAWTARADMASQTLSYTGTPNFTKTNVFDQYKGALAVTQILVKVHATVTGFTLDVTNSTEGVVTLDSYQFGTKNVLVVVPSGYTNTSIMVDESYDSTDLFPGGSLIIGGTEQVKDFTYTVPANKFSGFTGTGTFNIVAKINSYSGVVQQGGLTSLLTPGPASGAVTVEYYYTPQAGTIYILKSAH